MRVLIATQNEQSAHSLSVTLDAHGFGGELVFDDAEALQMLRLYDYDIAIFDQRCGAATAIALLKTARGTNVPTPIVVLGADDVATMIEAFEEGADDVVTKPFRGDELIVRLRAIARRARGHSSSTIRIGDLVVNLDRRSASIGEAAVAATGKEYALLELLALRRGVTLTKETILTHLYGGMDEPELKIIDVFICKLRKKLAMASHGRNYIETVWGRGYVLCEPEGCAARVQKDARVADSYYG